MKATSVLMALGAFVVLLAPASAQSSVRLTDLDGELVGGDMTMVSTNFYVSLPGFNSYSCERVVLHGEVGTNGPEHVTVENIVFTTEKCVYFSFVLLKDFPIKVTKPSIKAFTISEEGGGGGTATFLVDIKRPFLPSEDCGLKGGFGVTYETETDHFKISAAKLEDDESPAAEGCYEKGELWADFVLEDAAGNPLILD